MLRDFPIEKFPSYMIGVERGIEKGRQEGQYKTAVKAMRNWNLTIEQAAEQLDVPLEGLKAYIMQNS
jgi:predicted transposase YdaD